ncbi:MAG: hypothetical protein A2W90_13910 [Bacteroidetes bacterium GWF2_42_66]|nr:MAG: hypothetical protein A2W92_14625 [Bacteroidetes bacterium GWA2_42_15]OFX97346.1 MAG: hypothetical protein A2W89_01085 [Bacteroidetes bacterium GWE2_42_39]OFY39983.1 MAG: hypothetical protein A2W90_13910 [Bacteroidetes bacterium GWF2_42_66]HBL78177.1 NUDIX hydrolase [Prolixibacteraceae bacterium]HCU61123.1 NUDIX hydrolase [Prolixibacteraceae bacterium]
MMSQIIPNLSVDCAVFGFDQEGLKLLLIRRDKEPAMNSWSLPGGYIYLDENPDDAAKRLLNELTGVHDLFLSQIAVFGEVNRYPAGRVISTVYCALVRPDVFELMAGSHAREVAWHPVEKLPELPFDHPEMVHTSLQWLQRKIWHKPIANNLLPRKFPLNQLHNLYEAIMGSKIDNRNFRKKVLSQNLIIQLEEKTKGGVQRPAYLYSFRIN